MMKWGLIKCLPKLVWTLVLQISVTHTARINGTSHCKRTTSASLYLRSQRQEIAKAVTRECKTGLSYGLLTGNPV
jgi:hypothetical protein